MAVKAKPPAGFESQDNTTARGFPTPPGNARVPPGSREGSPRKGPPPTGGHGNMTRSGQERTRVDWETR